MSEYGDPSIKQYLSRLGLSKDKLEKQKLKIFK
jgi:hypothetical protein